MESQDECSEPAMTYSVPRRLRETTVSANPSHRHIASRSTTDPTPSNSHGQPSPRPSYSPTTSISSLGMSGRAEKSSSPSVQPNPWQLPYAPRDRDPAKRPEPLPPITSFESRDSPMTRGSSAWFDNHLGSTFNNTSPLSNYRRSFHPPTSFVHQDSTSSSKSSQSRSQSSDPSETSFFSSGPREDLGSHRQPPTSLRGLDAPNPSPPIEGLKPRGSILAHSQPGSFRSTPKTPPRIKQTHSTARHAS